MVSCGNVSAEEDKLKELERHLDELQRVKIRNSSGDAVKLSDNLLAELKNYCWVRKSAAWSNSPKKVSMLRVVAVSDGFEKNYNKLVLKYLRIRLK